jgi:ubiquitin fusion degradation protein 1
MFGGFGFGGGPRSDVFEETYRALPILSDDDTPTGNGGNRVFLPASALQTIANLEAVFPLQFKLTRVKTVDGIAQVFETHAGVSEFTANEGTILLPSGASECLEADPGEYITVRLVSLPLATFVKFQADSVKFLSISDPRAVLETVLRNFSCVTKGDRLKIPYNGEDYYLHVVDVKPANACSIVEADVKVDFDAPIGYVEPSRETAKADAVGDDAIGAAMEAAKATAAGGAGGADGGNAVGGGDAEGAGGLGQMAELARLRAERARQKQMEAKDANYLAFSGSGLRVDGKKKKAKGSKATKSAGSSSGAAGASTDAADAAISASAAAAPPPVPKSKWKTRNKGAAFHGEGRVMK